MGKMPELIGIAPCYVHGGNFSFDPDTVMSVPIDPVTGLTPDLGGDPSRCVQRVICPECITEIVNPERIKRGNPPVDPVGRKYPGRD